MCAKRKKYRNKKNISMKIVLTITLVALFAVLVVCGVVYLTSMNEDNVVIAADFSFSKPIRIETVSIEGMGEDEALAELEVYAKNFLENKKLTFSAGDQDFEYTAGELGVELNPKKALVEAYKFEKNSNYDKTEYFEVLDEETGSVQFYLKPTFNKQKALQVLTQDTEEINQPPKDATMKFVEGDKLEIEYVADEPGVTVDLEGLCDLLKEQVENQTFLKVTAPVETIHAELTVDQLKNKTSKIGSYTSSFAEGSLAAKGRVINIVKMAEVINGVEIMPGQTWSMNEEAGPRTEAGGWALAPGIENGVYTDQPGGGVCQVSSTLYNAALEAELEIVDSKRHSWPSGYIPTGLDATISTGGPDLKIQNNRSTPVFVVASVDKSKKTCTVDIYGEKQQHGYKVKYISKTVKTEAPPAASVRESTTDQNGKELAPGTSKLVREGKPTIYVKIYKQYLDENNNVVSSTYMYDARYTGRGAVYYENTKAPEVQPG